MKQLVLRGEYALLGLNRVNGQGGGELESGD
ncbi:hypothetical protein Mucpa_4809 [Mucilaginibacter paludis DSM 18603]|uniref:Uncharacterized protein n=1 Tax=Mucilaginibacter paludis DSM 18603 TaxID=714943 RepID=H1Y376_9SPHI|nr:hypothetical protein Mucpa_4809 [Mucilaginibacter paludis DSM 18603]